MVIIVVCSILFYTNNTTKTYPYPLTNFRRNYSGVPAKPPVTFPPNEYILYPEGESEIDNL